MEVSVLHQYEPRFSESLHNLYNINIRAGEYYNATFLIFSPFIFHFFSILATLLTSF